MLLFNNTVINSLQTGSLDNYTPYVTSESLDYSY